MITIDVKIHECYRDSVDCHFGKLHYYMRNKHLVISIIKIKTIDGKWMFETYCNKTKHEYRFKTLEQAMNDSFRRLSE